MVYVALLRGINVGGHAIVSMKNIKSAFEKAGMLTVQTYINSGNVIFKVADVDPRKLEQKIEKVLNKECKLNCKVVVKSFKEYSSIISKLPKTWTNDKTWRYNCIFLKHTVDSKKVLNELPVNKEVEKIVYCPGAIFWEVLWTGRTRSKVAKLNQKKIFQEMTVRNLNTTKKLFELMKKAS